MSLIAISPTARDQRTPCGESEAKYRNILESMEEGYFEVDLAGRLTFFNDSLCRILGMRREEMMGMDNRDYTTYETYRKMSRIFSQIYQTGLSESFPDYEIIRKDGTSRILELTASLITDHRGTADGFRGVARDVTDRKHAEKAIKESEERHRTVLETVPDPVVVTDVDQKITFVNPAFYQDFRMEPG